MPIYRLRPVWTSIFHTPCGDPDFLVRPHAYALGVGIPGRQHSELPVLGAAGLYRSGNSSERSEFADVCRTAQGCRFPKSPLRNTYPLWSAVIAVTLMGEDAGSLLSGTCQVVAGVVLISWKPDAPAANYRWCHIFYSLGAGLLAGIAFPLRRFGLTITNEPVFVAAVVSLLGAIPYLLLARDTRGPIWHPKGLLHFAASGFLGL